MPKSRRNKTYNLTATTRNGNVAKQKLVTQIRQSVEEYAFIYVFSIQNMRNARLKDIRTEWKNSRFFLGKNKVMALALGHGAEDEVETDLHKVSKKLVGNVGLLFTNRTRDDVQKWFAAHVEDEFARTGSVADRDFVVSEGPLTQFPHSMEVQLRQLGMPTSLKKGIVHMDRDYVVCSAGQTLTPQQAQILKLFGQHTVSFKVVLMAQWSKGIGYEELQEPSTTLQGAQPDVVMKAV